MGNKLIFRIPCKSLSVKYINQFYVYFFLKQIGRLGSEVTLFAIVCSIQDSVLLCLVRSEHSR
ncbi:mCG1042848 [Mus musculus]|nr:mCG1042848 [Mus musculus]